MVPTIGLNFNTPPLNFPIQKMSQPLQFRHRPCLKGIWYGSEPVVISLQLTNLQSLIGLRMHHMKSTKHRIEMS